MAIHTLSLDVETFSDVDLKKCGVYKYAESSDFEILLFGGRTMRPSSGSAFPSG